MGTKRKTFLKCILFAVISIATLEAGSRLAYSVTYGRHFASTEKLNRYRARLKEIERRVASYERQNPEGNTLHPYWGYVSYPFPPFSLEKHANDFSVLVLGGSVASGLLDAADTFIACLKADKRLQEKNIRLFDYTRAGYKQPQQLMIGNLFS